MRVSEFAPEMFDDILRLQHSLSPPRRHMTADVLRESLTDSARQGGRAVRVVFDGDELLGCAAWVSGSGGEFFGSPFIAKNDEAAEGLLGVLLAQASSSKWLRISAFPEEVSKIRTLEGSGFIRAFDFIEFETAPRAASFPKLPSGWTQEPIHEMNRAEFMDLLNRSFIGVDNSLPIGLHEADEILRSRCLHASFSRVLRNESGKAIAYSIGNTDGYIDSIGVLPSEQGKGIGTMLYQLILSHAEREKISRVFATVSSRNEASLRLHKRLLIPVSEKRTVWQLNL